MAKSASAPAPSSPPGGGGAFVYLVTVLIDLAFIAFVLIMGYPFKYAVIAVIAVSVISAVTLRHLYTGAAIPTPGFGRASLVKFLLAGLKAVQEDSTAAETTESLAAEPAKTSDDLITPITPAVAVDQEG